MPKKLTELPAGSFVALNDIIPYVDLASSETRKVTLRTMLESGDGIVATLSGSTFTGPVFAQITGSLTRTSAGTPFITAPSGNIITISTGSNGQIILSGSGGSGSGGGGYPPDYASLTGSLFTGPVTAASHLTASFGIFVGGSAPVTLAHSGATQHIFDSKLQSVELKGTALSSTGSPHKAIVSFNSSSHGRTYAADTIVLATSTTTTGSAVFKLSAHFLNLSGTLVIVGSAVTALANKNHAHLTASLTSSAGSIVVSGSQGASAEQFRWGCFLNTVELAGA